MKLKKCIKMLKVRLFDVYVYPWGHVKEMRGLDEPPIEVFSVERTKTGKIPKSKSKLMNKYAEYTVKEIIPGHIGHANITVEKKPERAREEGIMDTSINYGALIEKNKKDCRRVVNMAIVMEVAVRLNRYPGVDVYLCFQGKTGSICLTVEENKSQVYQREEFAINDERTWDMIKDLENMLAQKIQESA